MALEQRIYTMEDIQALPEGQRGELINGELFLLAAPSRLHQDISGGLFAALYSRIKADGKPCRVYAAPFAVYLFDNDSVYVEPDISVICDSDKLQADGCHGAPELIIEIASPSTGKRDLITKQRIYKEAGVKLYLLIMPDMEASILFDFQAGTTSILAFTDNVPVSLCPGFTLRIADYI